MSASVTCHPSVSASSIGQSTRVLLLLLVVGLLGRLAGSTTPSGCAIGMTTTSLPANNADYTAIDAIIFCNAMLGPNQAYRTYDKITVTIEAPPSSVDATQPMVYMQPAAVANINPNKLDVLSFYDGTVYDEEVAAGLTIQFPPENLTSIQTGMDDTYVYGSAFTNLENVTIDRGSNIVLKDLPKDQQIRVNIRCSFCTLWITGGPIIELNMETKNEVWIQGQIASGSVMKSGILYVDGPINGLNADTEAVVDKVFTTTNTCQNVLREGTSPCTTTTFAVSPPVGMCTAALPICPLDCASSCGCVTSPADCAATPSPTPSGGTRSKASTLLVSLAIVMSILASHMMSG